MDDLEVIKENVQPLRQGRKIETLKAALSCDSMESDKRESIREKFEKDIKQFKDELLFETYHSYINWIEQNYPKGGKEANFSKVLENCIQNFYKDEKYQNDERMLSIFLKYTNIVTDPISVFDFFYKTGFAKQLSRFYTDWAYHLEMQNNFKKAMQVIKVGIKNEAQPMSDLKRTLNDLEVRTLRFVSSNPEEPNNRRKALTKLKTHSDSHGKVLASIKRTVTNVNDGLKKINADYIQNENEPIKIYVENENKILDDMNEKNLKFNETLKENEIKVDKWCGNKLDLKKSRNNDDKFEIFIDSNENFNPQKDLKEPKIPVAIFEEKEKLKKYIWYDRIDEIYRDGTEYSFEELRYQKWLEEQETRKHETTFIKANTENHEPDTKLLFNDTKNASTIIRAFFNGTLCNTLNQTQMEKYSIKDSIKENSGITTELANQEDFYVMEDNSCLQANQFKSCSSSTPFQNKTFKWRHNMAVRSFNNPNFVNGITSKLSTIEEISREEYSKSSSSSSGTISSVGNHTSKKVLVDSENINPFDPINRKVILSSISDQIEFNKGYLKISTKLPTLRVSKRFNIQEQKYIIMDCISKNDSNEFYVYGKLPSDLDLDSINHFEFCSLKLCRDLDYWEFYIYGELGRRLVQNTPGPDIELSLMTLDRMIFYQDGYIAFHHDLDLNFTIEKTLKKFRSKQKKFSPIIISLIILELILIIQKLHDCEIIHSNISIENVVLFQINKDDIDLLPQRTSFTKIIDFSQAIDMRVLPDDMIFQKNYKNDALFEILNMKPWNYQIDWICFLNCIHIMAFDSELKISKQNTKWTINNSFENGLFFLNDLFDILLNLEPNQKPNLEIFVSNLISYLQQKKLELRGEIIRIFFLDL